MVRTIDLVFEGLLGLNLRPADERYGSTIFEATLRMKDGVIFFADAVLAQDEFAEGHTCVKALSLRWRLAL